MSADLRAKMAALREALPEMRDPKALAQAGEHLLAELGRLKPAERQLYAAEIGGLVGALEQVILTLQQKITAAS